MVFESAELGICLEGALYHGKPAFDAVALAKSLGYTNPAKALKDHCKSLIRLDYNESLEMGFGVKSRGTQLAQQADLFRLILRSQLPSAEKVQDWVCEEVLPSIMTTGGYGAPSVSVEPHKQEVTMNNDILSLARVVAEATASATMKAVIDIVGIPKHQSLPAVQPAPVIAVPAQSTFDLQVSHQESGLGQADYVPVADLAWVSGLTDSSCRRLVTFASLPTSLTNGERGHLLIHREAFMTAAQALLDESTPPTGKLKRWRHPEFGGFTLRLASEKHTGEDE
ncbi:Bro-N domain-containing protein [Rahnella sp. ChDrAdgB13]|uniref:BRO-N domain-containing protein n=1 Tax=Rahnella sp. ChDrAdgB13 TaxID=1850581 RepID=UPI0035A85E09